MSCGEDGDLELGGAEGAVGAGQRADRGPQRLGERPPSRPLLLEALRDRLGLAPEHRVAVLVGDGPLVGDVVELRGREPGAQLGDQDLDLERLHLVGEDLPEVLRVEIGERAGLDVLAAVGVPLGVGVADARDPELVELVVLAHAGEGDPVVDLADLVERPRRVVGHDGDPQVVGGGDERAAPGDALLGVLGPVLHDLFGRHVVGHGHGWRPSVRRRSMSAANRSATSSSGTATNPSAVTVATSG